jgi:toxin ParE1/3/4
VTNRVISRKAQQDLRSIYLYTLERFGEPQARRYLEAIDAKISLVAENPSFGAEYFVVRDGLRRYDCEAHAIYYEAKADDILVLRILHGRMDPGRHLR